MVKYAQLLQLQRCQNGHTSAAAMLCAVFAALVLLEGKALSADGEVLCVLLLFGCVVLQVRTVAAFGMEQGTVDKYDQALEYPEQVRLMSDEAAGTFCSSNDQL
jgi:hypothetical protein